MFCHVQFCTLNVHINICFCMGFRHAHLCTDDCPYSYGFFVMYIFVRMTIHIILVCIFVMYISIRMTIHILMDFCHVHLCTNDYPYYSCMGFVMYTSVRMDIHIIMGFRHAHLCTDDYPFPCVWVFIMHISVRLTISIGTRFVFVSVVRLGKNLRSYENENESSTGTRLGLALSDTNTPHRQYWLQLPLRIARYPSKSF